MILFNMNSKRVFIIPSARLHIFPLHQPPRHYHWCTIIIDCSLYASNNVAPLSTYVCWRLYKQFIFLYFCFTFLFFNTNLLLICKHFISLMVMSTQRKRRAKVWKQTTHLRAVQCYSTSIVTTTNTSRVRLKLEISLLLIKAYWFDQSFFIHKAITHVIKGFQNCMFPCLVGCVWGDHRWLLCFTNN